MAPNETARLMRSATDPAREAEPESDRNFGFLVHDVSRLIKRRFDRRARQTGLPITRRQAMVVLYIARNEGVS